MSKYTHEELRRAITALGSIERDGDRDEWAYIMRQAQDTAPAADPWGNVSIGARISAQALARRLSSTIGAPVGDCEAAAADVYGRDRGRAIYDALVGYAAETRRNAGRATR